MKWLLGLMLLIFAAPAQSQILIDQKKDGVRTVSTRAALLTPTGKSPMVYFGYTVRIEGKKKNYYLTVGVKSTQELDNIKNGDKLMLKVGERDVMKFTAVGNCNYQQSGNIYYLNSTYRIEPDDLERISSTKRLRICMSDKSLDVDVEGTASRNSNRQINALFERIK